MAVPRVEKLRRENWQTLSRTGKIEALQELEDGLARLENREPSTVKTIPEAEVEAAKAEGVDLRGYYRDSEKAIYINPERVGKDQPYDATSTLFHEADHAYQHEAVKNPEQGEDPEQVKEWEWNLTEEGYIRGDEAELGTAAQEVYRWQPVEKHANEVALQRNVELHGEQFQDPEFEAWQAEAEADLAFDKDTAETVLGSDYVDRAREYAHDRYVRLAETQSAGEQERGVQPRTVTGPISGPPEKARAASGEPEYEHTELETATRPQEIGEPVADEQAEVSVPEARPATLSTAGPEAPIGPERQEIHKSPEPLPEQQPGGPVRPSWDRPPGSSQSGQEDGQGAEQPAQAAEQPTEAVTEAVEGAASEAPGEASSEQGEDRDYDYGYGYGY